MKSRIRLWSCALVIFSLVVAQADGDDVLARQFRKPVAMAVIGGERLAVANHRSGTLSLVDLRDRKVVGETVVGKHLSDVFALANPDRLLATSEHELVSIRPGTVDYQIEKRLAVSSYPVTVRVNGAGTRAYVASLWSHTITVVDLTAWLSGAADAKPVLHQIRLPFAPREQLVVDLADQSRLMPQREATLTMLVVADGFGSKLAVIDPEKGRIESIREIPAHGIRAMRLHPTKPQLLMTHQMLNRTAHTTFDDVHWGNLLLNCLRTLDLKDLLDPKADLMAKSVLDFVGGPDRGAGEPAGFALKPGGITTFVAISGNDELAIDDGEHLFSRRLKTEHCPTAMVTNADNSSAYVANSLSDSISVVDLRLATVSATISLGPRPEETAVDRGERLFRSARLSHDNWFSCAGCHVEGHTNGLLNDNFTDGSFGTAKRILSLRGLTDTAPYAWSGRFTTLTDQIRHSIKSTMQGEPLEDNQISDLEVFLRSLPAPPAIGPDDTPAAARGSKLFEKLDCQRCHSTPTYTSERIVDVNLNDEKGNSRFNPPSLRGVSQNAPYFHDGRAATLEAVFTQFRHQLDRELTADELTELVEFLKSL